VPSPAAREPSSAQAAGSSGKAVPDWVQSMDSGSPNGAGDLPGGDGGPSPVSFPAPDAPAKSVGDLLKEAFELYKRHAKVLLLTAAILFVPGSLISSCAVSLIMAPLSVSTSQLERMAARQEQLARRLERASNPEELMREASRNAAEAGAAATVAVGGIMAVLIGVLAWVVVAFVMFSVIVPLTQGALTVAAADLILGRPSTWRDHWRAVFRRFGPLVLTLLLSGILTLVGLCLLLPGLILGFFFCMVTPVVLLEGIGGVAALKRSFALVKSDWIRVLLVLVVFGALWWIGHLVASIIIPGSSVFLGHLVGDIVSLVLLPVPVLGLVLIYMDLRRKSEGMDAAALRVSLDSLRA
jgi:hypothetical protein